MKGGLQSRTPLEKILPIVRQNRFMITVDLNLGRAQHTVYTTDFTVDYVKLNMGDGTGG